MKITNEIIEKLKNNLAQFDCMPLELVGAAKFIGKKFFELLKACGEWGAVGVWESLTGEFNDNTIYRLRPDYVLPAEKKMVRYEVKRIIDGLSNDKPHYELACDLPEDKQERIDWLVRREDFDHFERDDLVRLTLENIATTIRNGFKVYAVFYE